MTSKITTDPMELMIESALISAGISFTREDRNKGRPQRSDDVNLDFHLVDFDIYIEVKQFHSENIARQMASAPNVIAVQGETAVRALAAMIRSWHP